MFYNIIVAHSLGFSFSSGKNRRKSSSL